MNVSLRTLLLVVSFCGVAAGVSAATSSPELPALDDAPRIGFERLGWSLGNGNGPGKMSLQRVKVGDLQTAALFISSTPRPEGKNVVWTLLPWKASEASQLSLRLYTSLDAPPPVAVAVGTGPKKVWHEAEPQPIKKGWNRLTFSFKSGWKTAATKWEFKTGVADTDQIGVAALVVLNKEQQGDFYVLDMHIQPGEPLEEMAYHYRLHGVEQSLYQSAQTLAHGYDEYLANRNREGSRTLRPAMERVLDELDELRKSPPEQPDAERTKRVDELRMNLFMLVQQAEHRWVYGEKDETKFLETLNEFRGIPHQDLMPRLPAEIRLLVEKAETISRKMEAEGLVADATPAKVKPAVPDPYTKEGVAFREKVKLEDDVATCRRKLQEEDAAYEAAKQKFPTVELNIVRAARQMEMEIERKKVIEGQRSALFASSPGDTAQARAMWERESQRLTAARSDCEEKIEARRLELAAARGEWEKLASAANLALHSIRSGFQQLQGYSVQSPAVAALIQDPKNKTAAERKWANPLPPTRMLVMRLGPPLNVLKVFKFQSHYYVQRADGSFGGYPAMDVLEVKER